MEHPRKRESSAKGYALTLKDTNMHTEKMYDLVRLKGEISKYLIIKNKKDDKYDIFAWFQMSLPKTLDQMSFPSLPITVIKMRDYKPIELCINETSLLVSSIPEINYTKATKIFGMDK